MKGRRPKPLEQKRREGNRGKRRLPEPVTLSLSALEKPADLPVDAAAIWDELVPLLEHASIAQRPDAPALTALCIQWARGVQARRVIERQGLFARGSMGQMVEHPAVAIERNAHAAFLRFAEHYGLTAAARARIAAHVAGAKRAADEKLDGVIDLTPELVER